MRTKVFEWLGREFVALSCEGKGKTADEQARDIFHRLDDELRGVGLSLENTVRTRLWARDLQSRQSASNERFRILSGQARASSTSFVSPSIFDSDALVSLDLIVMRPAQPGIEKTVVEYEPPKRPCRYVIYDSFVFLTGEEAEVALEPPVLADQVVNILSVLGDSLTHAGVSWNQAVRLSSFLKRTESLSDLKRLLQQVLKADIPLVEYEFVDDFAPQFELGVTGGGLLEVEVTAKIA